MLTRYGSMIASLTLCSACASAPINVCPALPPPPVRVQQGESFQDSMQKLLNGLLPEPTSSDLRLPSAKLGSQR